MFEILSLLLGLVGLLIPLCRRRPDLLADAAFGHAVAGLGFGVGVVVQALPTSLVTPGFSFQTALAGFAGFLLGRLLARPIRHWARKTVAERAERDPDAPEEPLPRLMHPLIACGIVVTAIPMLANAVALRHASIEVALTPRDPTTGVILGAEDVTMDPLRPGVVDATDATDGAAGDDGDDAAEADDLPHSPHAVLLVHGYMGTRTDFGDLADALLEAGLAVRALRLPGHGTTPYDLATATGKDWVKAVRDARQDLGSRHERVSVVGMSFGGGLALLDAAADPPHRLVLVNPYVGEVATPPGMPVETATLARAVHPMLGWVMRPRGIRRVNREEGQEGHLVYATLPMISVIRMLDLGRDMAAADLLARVTCPTLLLLSDGDRTVPADTGARLARDLGGPVAVDRYARSDHVLFRDFDREDATARTVEFLTADDRSREGDPARSPPERDRTGENE